MNGLLVHRAPALAVVQDGGRLGLQHAGVTRGGPLDPWSMQWANAVVGNAPMTAALEVSFGGLCLEAMVDTCVAVGGTPVQLHHNNADAELWTPIAMQAGDQLTLAAKGACRNYVAVRGGFKTARVLGSRAMVLREGLGGLGDGLQARALRAGDLLPCDARPPGRTSAQRPALNSFVDESPLRVVPLGRQSALSRAACKQFFGQPWSVSTRADRMGCRLQGVALSVEEGQQRSFAVVPGCIQVPPDGQPIALLADCQTMGGYPVLGTVISADMPRLGRCMPGDSLTFAAVTPSSARRAWAIHAATLPP